MQLIKTSMLRKIVFLLVCLTLYSSVSLYAADAPVTMAGNVINAIPGTNAVAIPVTIVGFNDIGQFTLTMVFDTTRVRFVSATTNPALQGMSVIYLNPVSSQGKLIFSWTGNVGSNVTLQDGSSLVDLVFSYVTGTGILSWAYNFTSICQYSRYIGATLTTLNDSPRYLFYLNGGISDRGAPVTFAPVITVTGLGSVPVPLTVNAFTGIGAFTLELEYDPAIMTYQNFTKNPAFGSTFLVGNIAGNGGKMRVRIQWYGNAVTLTNGATLCTLNFNYTAPNSDGTTLIWFDDGPSCEYSDGSTAVLIDLPNNDFYHDGLVSPPVVSITISPSANPVCQGTPVTFTASGVNGGTSPVYQWKVNGNNTGSNSDTLLYVPVNDDVITCMLTSSESFVAGNPATSGPVVMMVNSLAVVADFTANNLTPPKNETVSFTDLSTGEPVSWNWSFDRPGVVFMNGTNPNSQNPQVKFTDGGLYTVTLVTTNNCFNDTDIKAGYIRAGIQGLWLGNTSSEWNLISNWDNYLMPDSNTNVVIPPSAQNWPVFEGDLILGFHCGSLTLSGTTSQITITGNLTIP